MNELAIIPDNVTVEKKGDESEHVLVMDKEFDYSGYQVVRGEFFSHLFEPSVTFNNEKITANASCINKLPNAEYVQILVNPDEKKLAIKPCQEEKRHSFCWVTHDAKGKRKPKTISCRVFCAKVMSLMGWNSSFRYKILGKLVRTSSEALFVFDLCSAETYMKKGPDGKRGTNTPYYPESWKNQFGVPAGEHQDTVLVEIFDDYAVFCIDKEEEKGIKKDDNNTGSEEKESTDTQTDA